MPSNKHKRKASAHTQSKKLPSAKSSGLIVSHPKLFVIVGLVLVFLGLYLLAFEAQKNSMFGLAMLALISGVTTTIYANFALSKKKLN